MPLVLLDNTVLTNFAIAQRSDLPTRLWPAQACTIPDAIKEYQAGAAAGKLPVDAWAGLDIVSLTQAEIDLASTLSSQLGAGERSCMAVARGRNSLVATDDLDARRVARRLSIPLTGTLGILVLCVTRGLVDGAEADGLLARMVAAGYRSPIASLSALLSK
jgi:predicted nucleic acid-binding protein